MKATIKFKEVKRKPIEKVTLELSEKEAFVLRILCGSITGGGEMRVIYDNIYHSLKEVASDVETCDHGWFAKNPDLNRNDQKLEGLHLED